MADVFSQTLDSLLADCPGILGVAFTDFDGEEIALKPAARKEQMRTFAVYGGIALRRLADAERKAGRGQLGAVVVKGREGSLVSMKVADAYQLVMSIAPTTPPARAIDYARGAVRTIEDNI